MTVKIEITQRGIFYNDPSQKGAVRELEKGEVLTLASEPKAWANKYRVIGGSKGKTLATGEGEGEGDAGDDDDAAEFAELAERYETLSGKKNTFKRLSTLREKVAELEA